MPVTGMRTASDGRSRGTSTTVAATAITAAIVPARDPEAYTPPRSVDRPTSPASVARGDRPNHRIAVGIAITHVSAR